MRILSIIITFCFLFFNTGVFAQKGGVKKGHQLFKEKKYATAIPYYQKALAEKYNIAVASKLAFCYKMNNKTVEAEALYAKIVQKDRAKDITYFYYAEALMSNGKYEEAKAWFADYLLLNPKDEASKNYIKACETSKDIPNYFDNVMIQPFSQNSDVDDNAPVFWNDGIVFTSDRKGKIKLLDEKSGWTGRNYLRLYYSKQQKDGSFNTTSAFVPKINIPRKNTGMATFTADGTAMYFSRNGHHLDKHDAYCLQLYVSKSNDGKRWKGADLLSFCSKEYNYMHPAVSPDGNYLFFVSDRPKGQGGADIYVSEKGKKGWSRPENLGETINTEGHEGFPFMHANGKLYFCSKGHAGFGGFDIFVTEKDRKGNWQTPINLGLPINSPADDISIFIDAAEQRGLFTSSREGGDDDIYLLQFAPPAVALDSVLTTPETGMLSTDLDSTRTPIEEVETITPNEKVVTALATTTNFLTIPQLLQTNTLQKEQVFVLPSLQFEANTYLLKEKHIFELAQLAEILKTNSTVQVAISSYVNQQVTTVEPSALMQNRVASIISYLMTLGIEKERLVALDLKKEGSMGGERVEIMVLAY